MSSAETPRKAILSIGLIALLYWFAGRLGLLVAIPPGFATPVWLASGVACLGLLRLGMRCWPGIVLGSFLINISNSLSPEVSVWNGVFTALSIAVGAALQALASAAFCHAWERKYGTRIQASRFITLMLLAGPVCCLINSSIGAATLWATGRIPESVVLLTWATWWFGDTLGVLFFAPLIYGVLSRSRLELSGAISVCMILVTLLAWRNTASQAQHNEEVRFQALVNETVGEIKSQEDSIRVALNACAGLFYASVSVERDEFKHFVETLNIRTRFPSVWGFGYIQWVPKERFEKYIEGIRKDNAPNFSIHPEPTGSDAYVIQYIEPEDRNGKAIGLNLGYESTRLEALQRSLESGTKALSGPIQLIQNGTKKAVGFIYVNPMFKRDVSLATPEERKANLIGWTYAPMQIDDWFTTSPALTNKLIQVTAYEGDPKNGVVLHGEPHPEWKSGIYDVERTYQIGGRTWTLRYSALPAFFSERSELAPSVVLLSGLIFSMMLAWLVLNLANTRQQALDLADEMTQDLRAKEAELIRAVSLRNGMLNSANYAIISTTTDGVVTSFNRGAERMLGYQEKDLVGKETPALWHEKNEVAKRASELSAELGRTIEPGFEAFVAKARLGIVDENEWTLIRKDGTRFPVLLSATALRDPDENIIGFLGVIADITERKKAEQALAANETILRQFIRHTPAAVAMLDTDMRYLQTSERWMKDYHLDGQEIIGRTHYEVFPDIPERWRAIHQRVLQGVVESCEEDPFPRADGGMEWLQWEARPWLKGDGEIGGLMFFTQVITARKEAEEKMRQSEERFRNAIEYSAIGFALVGLDGRWLKVNRALCGIVGYKEAELLSRTFQDITHPDDLEMDLHHVKEMLDGKSTHYHMEKRYVHQNGSAVWVLLSVSLVRDRSGHPSILFRKFRILRNARMPRMPYDRVRRA